MVDSELTVSSTLDQVLGSFEEQMAWGSVLWPVQSKADPSWDTPKKLIDKPHREHVQLMPLPTDAGFCAALGEALLGGTLVNFSSLEQGQYLYEQMDQYVKVQPDEDEKETMIMCTNPAAELFARKSSEQSVKSEMFKSTDSSSVPTVLVSAYRKQIARNGRMLEVFCDPKPESVTKEFTMLLICNQTMHLHITIDNKGEPQTLFFVRDGVTQTGKLLKIWAHAGKEVRIGFRPDFSKAVVRTRNSPNPRRSTRKTLVSFSCFVDPAQDRSPAPDCTCLMKEAAVAFVWTTRVHSKTTVRAHQPAVWCFGPRGLENESPLFPEAHVGCVFEAAKATDVDCISIGCCEECTRKLLCSKLPQAINWFRQQSK